MHSSQFGQRSGERRDAVPYDTVPYDSVPFAHTQPANLAALGTLFGLKPPAVATARVLELGCASGGNIVPLAARFSGAQFTGIDLSVRHVEMARTRIAAAGLTNIAIRQGDLAEPEAVSGTFDYIICHGVFSWVPPAVQQRIFDICRQHLAPGGIAYISYNVLPGWQLRKVIRDIFLFESRASDSLPERVAKGRRLLDQLAAISSEDTPHGQLLRREAKQLAAMPDSYIIGEFLSDNNAPCYFREFVARARTAGLAYLCETDLHTALIEFTSLELKQLLTSLAGPDPVMAGHYFDLLQGRQFRQSLLVRAEQSGEISRTPEARRIAGLHFASNLRLAPRQESGDAQVLRDPGGQTITTNDPIVADALDALGRAAPETRTLQQLLDTPGLLKGTGRETAAERIMGSLLQVIVAGLASMSTVALAAGKATARKPAAWSIARQDLLAGQPWVTSLRHMPLRLDPLASALLPLVDGRNDRAELAARLRALVSEGKLDRALLDRTPAGATPGSDPIANSATLVELVLMQLEQLALLEAAR